MKDADPTLMLEVTTRPSEHALRDIASTLRGLVREQGLDAMVPFYAMALVTIVEELIEHRMRAR